MSNARLRAAIEPLTEAGLRSLVWFMFGMLGERNPQREELVTKLIEDYLADRQKGEMAEMMFKRT